MSYILDALRRADAERRRGQAPALQQVAAPSSDAPGRASRAAPQRALTITALALLALAATAAWWWSGRDEAQPLPSAVVAPPPPTAVPQLAPAPTPVVVAPAAPAVVVAPAAPAVVAKPPLPGAPVVAAPAPAPALARPRVTQAAAEARIAAPAPAPMAASTPPPRPIAASALPEPQRSMVAQLAFGGAVQSQDRSQSFVLLAGQIVREGDTLAPGIVLERIGARTLLLRVEGRAVEMAL